jgi:hypothetical protein
MKNGICRSLWIAKRKNKMGRICSTHGGKRNAYRILAENAEENKLLGRPTDRWENNIKADLIEIVWRILSGLIWLWIRTSGRVL